MCTLDPRTFEIRGNGPTENLANEPLADNSVTELMQLVALLDVVNEPSDRGGVRRTVCSSHASDQE